MPHQRKARRPSVHGSATRSVAVLEREAPPRCHLCNAAYHLPGGHDVRLCPDCEETFSRIRLRIQQQRPPSPTSMDSLHISCPATGQGPLIVVYSSAISVHCPRCRGFHTLKWSTLQDKMDEAEEARLTRMYPGPLPVEQEVQH
jgi:hypothetical protein